MEVADLAVEDLVPNPWNVNRMKATVRRKLTAYLRREGLVEPLVVREHPTQKGKYEILGGFHRWSICKDDLCYETVPCVVVAGLDDKRAKILSVNLNEMSGQPVPSLLSELLHGLEHEIPLDDLEATLPYEKNEIVDFLSLMQVPAGFADALEAESEEYEKQAPNVLTVVLDHKQHEVWERAFERAREEIGKSRSPKARAIELMARLYVKERRGGDDVGEH